MNTKQKINLGLLCFAIIFIGISLYSYDKRLGAFPTHVSNGDTITSADWNTMIDTITSSNSYDVAYTGHLTITSATTTNQTLTNLWATNATITNLTAPNFTLSNNSVTPPKSSGQFIAAGTGITVASSTDSWTITNSLNPVTSINGMLGGLTFAGTANQITLATTTQTLTFSIPDPATLGVLTVTSMSSENATSTASLRIPYGSMSLTADGYIVIDSTDNNFHYRSNGAVQVISPTSTRSFTVASTSLIHGTPIRLRRAQSAETLKEVWCTQTAGALDSTTNFNLYYGSNVAQAGTQVWNAQTVETSTSTGTFYYAFDNSAISAGDMVWAKVATSTGGTGTFSCDLYTKLNE